MKVLLLSANVPPTRCGVGDYSTELARALTARGDSVVILTGRDQVSQPGPGSVVLRNVLPGWGPGGMPTLWRAVRAERPDVVMLQWVPFLYSRTGTNLALPVTLALLSLAGVRLQVMVHEPWVRFIWWSYFITGPVQRLALGIVIAASERVHVSIGAWREMLARRFPWKRSRIQWVPVGSNIPLMPAVAPMRTRHGIPADVTVVGIFSLSGAAKSFDSMTAAWQAVVREQPQARIVLIGATHQQAAVVLPQVAEHPHCIATGELSAADVSSWMQAIDLLVAPFEDGVSSRRTTVMAAMSHGVPVVTTRGRATDSLFLESPLVMTEPKAAAFATATAQLASDRARWTTLGSATRAFHERHFGWPAIVERLLPSASAVPGLRPEGARSTT